MPDTCIAGVHGLSLPKERGCDLPGQLGQNSRQRTTPPKKGGEGGILLGGWVLSWGGWVSPPPPPPPPLINTPWWRDAGLGAAFRGCWYRQPPVLPPRSSGAQQPIGQVLQRGLRPTYGCGLRWWVHVSPPAPRTVCVQITRSGTKGASTSPMPSSTRTAA